MHTPDCVIDEIALALAGGEETPRERANASKRQVGADGHRLNETVTLAIFGHQDKTAGNAPGDAQPADVLPFEENLSAARAQTACDAFEEFRASGPHQSVDADDFAGTHFERQAI